MRFTTSSSKWALVRSDLRRFWPLLFGYAVLWLCAMPVALWSHRDYARTLDHVRVLCDIVNSYFSNGGIVAAAIVPACFTVLLAMALFSYLMNSRSVGLMHSLPITRGAQFGVHFAVGVGMFTAVHVVTALISLPVQAALGAVDLQGTLEWLAVAEVSGLLFFSLSTLCAMVTGWLLAIPVIYAGVNFLFAAFYLLYSAITQIFCWGYEASGWPGWLDWLTPTVRLLWQVTDSKAVLYGLNDRGFRCYVDRLSSGAWTTLAVYLAVAVLLAAVAYCFYRARHSETAGDAIVFPWLRPVVLYVIALAGGMGLGILLMVHDQRRQGLGRSAGLPDHQRPDRLFRRPDAAAQVLPGVHPPGLDRRGGAGCGAGGHRPCGAVRCPRRQPLCPRRRSGGERQLRQLLPDAVCG